MLKSCNSFQQKHTPWEGGVRSAGLIWSPLLKTPSRVSEQLMHSSDWLPTLIHLAGVEPQTALDGFNMWNVLSKWQASPRNEVVHNIDPIYPYTSYLLGIWKYVNGTVNPNVDTWLGDIKTDNPSSDMYPDEVYSSPTWKAVSKYRASQLSQGEMLSLRQKTNIACPNIYTNSSSFACEPLRSPCLFNIQADPCEQVNLAESYPSVVKVMEQNLSKARRKVVAPLNKPLDPRSDPGLNNYQWTYWLDLLENAV